MQTHDEVLRTLDELKLQEDDLRHRVEMEQVAVDWAARMWTEAQAKVGELAQALQATSGARQIIEQVLGIAEVPRHDDSPEVDAEEVEP